MKKFKEELDSTVPTSVCISVSEGLFTITRSNVKPYNLLNHRLSLNFGFIMLTGIQCKVALVHKNTMKLYGVA